MPAEARFRAMGSDVHIVAVRAREGALDRARRQLAHLERLWSRFLPDSEVSRVNAAAGAHVTVSAPTRMLFERAIDGWRATAGLYDPSVLPAVVAAGYDRSFDQIEHAGRAGRATSTPAPGCADVVITEDTVALPEHVGFDPGGIGKGLAADLVVARALAEGDASGLCVNVGGDVRVAGDGPFGEPWVVGIEDPLGDRPLARIALDEGAVATSSRARRRWRSGGRQMHHLIDPRTGHPAVTEVLAATVVAGEAWWAEVLAKVAFLVSLDRAAEMLEGFGVPALVVAENGERFALAGIKECLT